MNVIDIFSPKSWLTTIGGPRYIQLQHRIEMAIENGHLPPASPLPPEREIAAMSGLSRVTVRKAIEPLVEKGMIVQRRGSGSFVSPNAGRVEQALSRLTSFTEDMARREMNFTSVWLKRGLFSPSPQEVLALGLRADEQVSRIARLRSVDGIPLAIERAALPSDILPNPLVIGSSLYEALEENGNRPVRAIQRISAANLGHADAELLSVEAGTASLKIERTSYLPSGRVVEFTQSIYRGDKYDFVAELQISS